MNTDMVLHLGRDALQTAMLLSAPVLIATLVIGVLTAMFQAVTSIKDQTLGVVIKLVVVGVTLLVAGNWMMQVAIKHATEMFQYVAMVGH
jgi:flagellar biosynthetic protein FliQ